MVDRSVLVCREFSWDLVEIFSEAIVRPYILHAMFCLHCIPCSLHLCLQLDSQIACAASSDC